MTFLEIKQEVQKNLVRRQQEITDLIPYWINRVQREICRLHNFNFLKTITNFSTLPDTPEYDLPQDYKDDLSLWWASPKEYKFLPLITYAEALKLYPPDAPKGPPEKWSLQDGIIRIYPTPDGEYTILQEYYKILPDLVNDTDTNYLTENFPDVLIKGAVAEGMIWLQEGDATIWIQRYQEAVRMLIMYDQKRKLPKKYVLKYSLGAEKEPIKWKG